MHGAVDAGGATLTLLLTLSVLTSGCLAAPLPDDPTGQSTAGAPREATASAHDASARTVLTKDVWVVTQIPGPCTAPPSATGCTWYLSPDHPPALAVRASGDAPAEVEFTMSWTPSVETNRVLAMDVYDSTANRQHLVSGTSPVTLTLELHPDRVYEMWPMPSRQDEAVVHQEVELQASGAIEDVPDHHEDRADDARPADRPSGGPPSSVPVSTPRDGSPDAPSPGAGTPTDRGR